jgi:hypothetical protein
MITVIQRVDQNAIGIRQLASIILFHNISSFWKNLSFENKNYIKKTLLGILMKEKS